MLLTLHQNENTDNTQKAGHMCKYCQSADTECIPPTPFLKKILKRLSLKKSPFYKCVRKPIVYLRALAYFPLFGTLIPDLTFGAIGRSLSVPTSHLIIYACSLMVIISTYAIQATLIYKNQVNKVIEEWMLKNKRYN